MNVSATRVRPSSRLAPIFVDLTHCAKNRAVTGLERLALDLFSESALSPLPVTPIQANGRAQMTMRQTFLLPLLLATRPKSILLCPGFPPTPLASLFGGRVLPYIHDLFLITRTVDLNLKARAYMTPSFRFVVKRAPRFFANSQKTSDELRRVCRSDAQIQLFRPPVANPFALKLGARAARSEDPGALRLIALGTVEPRKNISAAAAIVAALRAGSFPNATLDVVGRIGWGVDSAELSRTQGVTLHGFQTADRVRELVEAADVFITTSHDEGLGSGPLEAQWAGLPVVAPDLPVFRETLPRGAVFVDASDPAGAAARLSAMVHSPGWRARYAEDALWNVRRWNDVCAGDRGAAMALIEKLAAGSLAC